MDDYVCPEGYLCLGGAIHYSQLDNVTVTLCAAGAYCKKSVQYPCHDHMYNPRMAQGDCVYCPAGFYCPEDNSNAGEDEEDKVGTIWPTPCPVGKYCEAATALSVAGVYWIDCPAGTYSPVERLSTASQCLDCPPGVYCTGGEDTWTDYCEEGYICT